MKYGTSSSDQLMADVIYEYTDPMRRKVFLQDLSKLLIRDKDTFKDNYTCKNHVENGSD